MELKITGEPKEIAELVRQLQTRQDGGITKFPVIQMKDERPEEPPKSQEYGSDKETIEKAMGLLLEKKAEKITHPNETSE